MTSVAHIHRWITRLELNLQQTGKMGDMKKSQPT